MIRLSLPDVWRLPKRNHDIWFAKFAQTGRALLCAARPGLRLPALIGQKVHNMQRMFVFDNSHKSIPPVGLWDHLEQTSQRRHRVRWSSLPWRRLAFRSETELASLFQSSEPTDQIHLNSMDVMYRTYTAVEATGSRVQTHVRQGFPMRWNEVSSDIGRR
ncbi:uncharacterized protein BCR38DRAFT_158757 [Pseudomassariella vexata]|uniref:Uncharacterized protein n=1 Tax=Pseudomassariella vexata TaxID=1141098 RepID=A0A1Y2E7C0_9PEZI|nr:uncharacterized protein BCR38DRAFT_158757 [Pseudomassariella vexata]ORY67458.1 hypothetical protein BCR38DRAFT_158757 [Pseudomassariella vexata]